MIIRKTVILLFSGSDGEKKKENRPSCECWTRLQRHNNEKEGIGFTTINRNAIKNKLFPCMLDLYPFSWSEQLKSKIHIVMPKLSAFKDLTKSRNKNEM